MHAIQRQSSQVFLNIIYQDYSTFHTVMKNYEEDPDVELNVVHIGASEKKKPYLELKSTDHAICKSITEGKVKE
ncbi:hypothetical protein P8452_53422 [Trifolium repens]|nr:hypothetical protein P8452_53422 [Trifolium repens]